MNRPAFSISCLSASLVLAFVVGCSRSAPEKPGVEGRWSGFDEGRPEAKLTVQFDAGRFTYWDAQTNELGHGTYQANDSVQPAQLDLTFEASPSPNYVGKVGLAIYEFKGDVLRMAGSEPGSTQRPTNFVGTEGVRVFSWKRE